MLKLKVTAGLLLAIALGAGATAVLPARPSLAQTTSRARPQSTTPASRSASSSFGGFFAPKGRAMPQDSAGGASRGYCLHHSNGSSQQTVTLLTPMGNSGLTTAPRPTFLAYIDQSSAQQVFFSLKNADESYFYEMTLTLPKGNSNRVAFQLPETAPPLNLDESYRWSVAVICGNKLGPDSPWAAGWIERVAPAPEQAETLAQLSPLEQASYFGRQGLWYDTVETLAKLQERQPSAEVEAAWETLMQDGGVEAMAQR